MIYLHVTCDVIGKSQYHVLKSKMAAMYFALCQNLRLFLVNLHLKINVESRAKTVLVTLLALNTRNLNKILM